MNLTELLKKVVTMGGTEIHFKIGLPPLIRQGRFLKRLDVPPVKNEDLEQIINEALTPEEEKRFNLVRFHEGNIFGKPPCNYRLNLFQAQSRVMALIKIIRQAAPTFEEIGLPVLFDNVITSSKGLFIFSGPARSGISTSLAGLVERINQKVARHVLIIEDPIEFYFEPKKSRISQRQFRKDMVSVEQGINFAKRMDVDVMVIGDLKEELPYRNILEYVAGGHFVILTMQTLGIIKTVEKIICSFPDSDNDYVCNTLSENLIGICSQALLTSPDSSRVAPIHEVLLMSNVIRGILQKGKFAQIDPNIKSAGEGSRLFEKDINRVLQEGGIPRETCEAFLASYRGMKG